jgi:uncharacterized membrane protein YkvA (DUF1232 family)
MSKPLPLFQNLLDPNLEKIFTTLCDDISPSQVSELQKQIIDHVQDVRDALQQNEFIDLDLAERISRVLLTILGEIPSYPEIHRRMIIGAARYFVLSQDAQADFKSVLGFDDDLKILNYVLRFIGRNDLQVDL